eukprot:TRINITY_DN316_c0_g2_i13.p1 TRINITY_DN316_c0_g2~~TRINITY_DN316_c0_g2_i13.p1  ORF type:complete len:254 (-),score=31.56 TRINITY_DN316_c0_g2_i13:1441-2202(-)
MEARLADITKYLGQLQLQSQDKIIKQTDLVTNMNSAASVVAAAPPFAADKESTTSAVAKDAPPAVWPTADELTTMFGVTKFFDWLVSKYETTKTSSLKKEHPPCIPTKWSPLTAAPKITFDPLLDADETVEKEGLQASQSGRVLFSQHQMQRAARVGNELAYQHLRLFLAAKLLESSAENVDTWRLVADRFFWPRCYGYLAYFVELEHDGRSTDIETALNEMPWPKTSRYVGTAGINILSPKPATSLAKVTIP